MKSDVEAMSPTRVKLSVEVPFAELEPAVSAAYRKLGQQVRVQGFRPGKVPARILDQRVGRGKILTEAVNDALPKFYGDAIRDNDVRVIGQPEIEVTKFEDGDELAFTAEVDVRPTFDIPDYDGLPVTVDDVTVDDERLDEQLSNLRDRFATLSGVERPVRDGDYVSIDLAATVDGEAVDDASATGLSYEVGTGTLIAGLDEALAGMSEGESKTFDSELRYGPKAGQPAQIEVTVRGVRVKELPELDDDFAQTASEFDTLAELREDMRGRLERIQRMQQGLQARDRALDALLDRVDVPLPEKLLEEEVAFRRQSLEEQLAQAGMTKEDYVAAEGTTIEDFDKDLAEASRKAMKSQFVLDAIAEKEELQVGEGELTDQVVRRAQRVGVPAEEYAQQVVQSGQVGALMAEVLRAKALALVLEHATVTDASGNPVDLEALQQDVAPAPTV